MGFLQTKAARTLHANDHGAMMVLGLFMAIFLVGMLFYAVGVGETIYHRERMQDFADSAAFSSAVMHARGMNVIALINIIMAGLFAVLVALAVVKNLCLFCIVALNACAASFFLSVVCIPISGVATPVLEGVYDLAETAYSAAKPVVNGALYGLHLAGEVSNYAFPAVAQVDVMTRTSEAYSPPATIGAVWPIYKGLPTETDKFDKLCKKAKEYTTDLASMPFETIPLGPVTTLLKGFIGVVVEVFATGFCDPNYKVPPVTKSFDSALPGPSDAERACREEKTKPGCAKEPGGCKAHCTGEGSEQNCTIPVSDPCRDAAAVRAEEEPDHTKGCQGNEHCVDRARRARAQCLQKGQESFIWQEAVYKQVVKRDGAGRISIGEPVVADEVARIHMEPPQDEEKNPQPLPPHVRPCNFGFVPSALGPNAIGLPPDPRRQSFEKVVNDSGLLQDTNVIDFTRDEWPRLSAISRDASKPVCVQQPDIAKIGANLHKGEEKTILVRGVENVFSCNHTVSQTFEFKEKFDATTAGIPENAPALPSYVPKDSPLENPMGSMGDSLGDSLGGSLGGDSMGNSMGSTEGMADKGSATTNGGTKKGDSSDSSSRAPRKMVDDKDLFAGAEIFQLRAFSLGEAPSKASEEIIKTIGFEDSKDDSMATSIRSITGNGRFYFAQAEYYFDCGGMEDANDNDKNKCRQGEFTDEWLWKIAWRARLRRIHFETEGSSDLGGKMGGSTSSQGDACQKAADNGSGVSCGGEGGAGGFGSLLDTIQKLVVH